MNLNEYLKETFSSNNHYNYDNSITNSVVPLRKANMEALLYYLGTIVLIYGIYMSDAKFKSKILIFWILVVLVTTFITHRAVLLPGFNTLLKNNEILDHQEILANLAISFAITAILIV